MLRAMPKVTGIGGVFFKTVDQPASLDWYETHLGMAPDRAWGGQVFDKTAWSIFTRDTKYFGDTGQDFMVNYRVDDLAGMLTKLRAEGVRVDDHTEESELGKFGWAYDGDGNRLELWEPPEGM
jgi:catechol 2,3-dioxygenase-like lactoylglutathione lyase family enzyme